MESPYTMETFSIKQLGINNYSSNSFSFSCSKSVPIGHCNFRINRHVNSLRIVYSSRIAYKTKSYLYTFNKIELMKNKKRNEIKTKRLYKILPYKKNNKRREKKTKRLYKILPQVRKMRIE